MREIRKIVITDRGNRKRQLDRSLPVSEAQFV